MINKWLLILIFLSVILFSSLSMGSSWATDPQQSNTGFNNSSNVDDIFNLNDVSNDSQISNSSSSPIQNETSQNDILISGNVIRCDSGAPFPGVNVEISDLTGNEIARTLTDQNGNYNFNFKGGDLSYKVTASYPGHVTLSKIIGLSLNGAMFYGTANFQLGPEPVVTINAPADQFLNETFNFTLNFDNVGNETGFGPIVQLILPPEILFNSANFLGSPVSTTFVGVFNSSGILTDPLSKLNVTGTNGSSLYIFEFPLGSYTKGQPIATISINALLLGNSTLGVPLNITAYPVFRFGANETGTTPIRGNASTAWVTPTVIKLTKTSDAPEAETATGRNYPITYTLTVDIANGQTVSPVDVKDIIPSNLQFIQFISTDGGIIINQPSTTVPGGNIWIQFSSITGTTSTEKTITYQVYAPKFDNMTNYVLNPNTGLPTNATNLANASGIFRSLNVSSVANYTLTLRSLAIQKGVTVLNATAPSPKPTDILKYDLNFQISDYFKLNNLIIRDTLGDGQTFLNTTGYIPYLTLHLPYNGTLHLAVNLTNPNEFLYVYDNNTGITYLTFNVTQLLIDNGYNGILEGGNYTGTDYGATRGVLTFWSQIDVNYQNKSLVPTPHPIVSSDVISNSVTTDANLFNSSNVVTDGSSSSVTIVAPTSQKTIYKINGQDPGSAPYTIRPGDVVTFSILANVPTTNLYNFYMMDYLPIPIFRASEFVNLTPVPKNATDTPPPAGRWQLAWDSNLSDLTGQLPWLIVDPTQNTLKFCYANVTNSSQPMSLAHIYFTVTATGDPMADGLWLTNWLNINWENTPGTPFQQNHIVSILTGEPVLTITKNATPTTNLQAGDVVNYTVTIKNTGNAPAYNVVVADDLLTTNAGYLIFTNQIAAHYGNGTAITGLTLSDLFLPTGLNFTASYPLGFNNTNDTIIIEYNVTLNSTVYPRQIINNTAQITAFTSLPGAGSPNYVTDPTLYQATASVQVRDVAFDKTYVGSQGGPSTGSNLTIGEVGRFQLAVTLPAGQITNLVITDILPAGMTYVSHNVINNTGIILAPLTFTNSSSLLTFAFNGLTNTTNLTNGTFYIYLDLRMADNSTANPPHTGSRLRTNSATMDWNNIGHSPITKTADVYIIEPNLNVYKSINPSSIQGGMNVTVNLNVSNNGANALSTAYNVIIIDDLSWASTIFDLSSSKVKEISTPTGFVFSYDSINKIITYTGGNISVGQTLNFIFNLTALDVPYIGDNRTNTANATYWSLPWTGGAPDSNSRNYNNSGSATILPFDPRIQKTVETSSIHGSTGYLTIGEDVIYKLNVSLPQMIMEDLEIVDILPQGFRYNNYTIDTTGFIGSILIPPSVTQSGQNVTFLFSGVTNSSISNNNFTIYLNATVLNVTSNNSTVPIKTNNMTLTWEDNYGPVYNTSVNTTIVEPKLAVTKTASSYIVDGGDVVTITLKVDNNGDSPAYQIKITDLLDNTLFDPNTFVEYPDSFYTFTRAGNLVTIEANTGIYLANRTSRQFSFNVTVRTDVPSNSTFINLANISYSSMNSTFTEARNYTNSSNTVTFTTPTPSIAKAVVSTSEPDSSGNNVFIGEVVTYSLTITIPEGKTLSAVLRDALPPNLGFISGSGFISRSNLDINSNNFTFTPGLLTEPLADSYFTGNVTNINFGNITYTGIDGLHNGTITVLFNVTVLNIAGNTNTTTIINNATFNFTNSSGSPRSLISNNTTLNVKVPYLTLTKTPSTTTAQGGQDITFTVTVTNSNGIGGAPAYNLQILDPLNSDYTNLRIVSMTYPIGVIITNSSTPNLLNISVNQLNQSQSITINYNVTVKQDVKFNATMNNTANATGTSLSGDHGTGNLTPGDPGTSTGKRTGQDGTGGLNNIFASQTATVTARSPTVSKSAANDTVPIGYEVPYTITITVPEGFTEELYIMDYFPSGLYYKDASAVATPSSGIIIGTFTVTGTNPIDFNIVSVNATIAGTINITYIGVVQNLTSTKNGTTLMNNITLYYSDPQNPGQYINGGNSSKTITVIEPAINLTKSANPTNVDGGDVVTITLNATNIGSSPAYQIIITDNLDPNLFDDSFSYAAITGYTFVRNVNTVTITANTVTSIAAGANQTFTFFLKVRSDVISNSTFTNIAGIQFSSMPPGYNETRNYTNSSNTTTFTTPTTSITKAVVSTSEPDSTGNNVFIGEVVTYQLTLTIPEGKTLSSVLQDIIPSNLGFISGTGRIIRSNDSITSTGFAFNASAGVPQFLNDTYFAGNVLNINFGNITYTGTNGLHNGTITILFNATVLNIAGNQNGTQIINNGTFNFTNATETLRSLTSNNTTLNVIVPKISVTKTANKSLIEGGETVTYTIVVQNNAGLNSAPVYDIEIIDYLPAGLLYSGIVNLPLGWTVNSTDPTKVVFTSPVGYKLDNGTNVTVQFNVTAIQNITYNSTLNNTVNATGTTLPGPHGTNNATPGNPGNSNGERTGDPTQPAGAVNDIIANGNVVITSRSPSISKGTNRTTAPIGETATQTITVPLPVGYTPNFTVVDNLPLGLSYITGSLIVSLPAGTTSEHTITDPSSYFIINGQNMTFNFGWINSTSGGNITINYTVMVNNNSSNVNGTLLTNNATLTFKNGQGGQSTSGPASSTIRVVEPQLQMTKTSDKTNYNPGENVIFTLNVSHTSGSASDAYNLVIRDTIPAGLTYQNGSSVLPAGWLVNETQSGMNIIIFYTNSTTALLLGQNAIINFTCIVGNYTWAGQNLTNNASLNYTSTFNETNARSYGPVNANRTIHVIGADIYVIKTTSTPTIYAGQTFNYTLTIGNNGPDTAVNVMLNDLIDPAWFGWLNNVRYYNGTWNSFTNPLDILVITNLLPGNNITINITGIVNSSAPVGAINNTATVNSTTVDPNPANNTSKAQINVLQQSNLSINKAVDQSIVVAGTPLLYTVTVKNNGSSDAQSVTVTDTLPNYVTGNSYSVNGGVWTPWTNGVFNLGTIAFNQTITILINGTVNATTPNGTLLNNTVNVTSPTDPNSHQAWASSTVNTVANLGITKANNPGSQDVLLAGNNLLYTITITNPGPSVARNVMLYDNTLSSWLTNRNYSYSVNGGSWSSWIGFSGPLAIDVTALFPASYMGVGENFTVRINSTVNTSTPNGTVLINYANVTSTTSPFNNSSNTVTNHVQTVADLEILKSAPPIVISGNSISYMVTVKNNGPSDAQSVTVTDSLPNYVIGDFYSVNGGSWTPWTNGVFNLGTMLFNQTMTILINGTVNASTPNGTVLNNTANVTSPTDPVVHNASAITTVNTLANLEISKAVTESPTVIAGTAIHYTVNVKNNGPSDAQDVRVYDTLPAYVTGLFYSVNGGSWFIWPPIAGYISLGTLAVNQTVQILINGTVIPSAPNATILNNTANITSPTDPVVRNASATTTVNTLANLEINKAVTEFPLVNAGSAIHYTVNVKNNGPSDAQSVIVADTLPNYVTGLFYSVNGGNWLSWPPTGVINLTTIPFNQTFTVLINGTVSSSAPNGTLLNNTVNVTSPTDPVVHNASAATTVNTMAALTITKVADVDKIIRGYPIHYTITITNTGPSDALNVNFYDDFTLNILENTYYSTSTGIPWTSFNAPLNLTNLVAALAPGNSIFIWINGTVATNASGNLTNNATTNSETDPTGNKTASVTTPMQTANLTIDKTVSNPMPVLGQTIYYTINVKNWGPDTAIDVYVVDKLPAGVTYVSSTANYGSYNPNTGIWTIGNLTKDSIAQLVITCIVQKLGVLQNTAYVHSASDNPSNGTNSSSSSSITVVSDTNNGKTIGMQKTGMPLPLIVIAILAVLVGLKRPKRK